MKNNTQQYATRVFYSEKHAIEFKIKLGVLCLRTIKQDKLGRYKVQWLIDKTLPKYS